LTHKLFAWQFSKAGEKTWWSHGALIVVIPLSNFVLLDSHDVRAIFNGFLFVLNRCYIDNPPITCQNCRAFSLISIFIFAVATETVNRLHVERLLVVEGIEGRQQQSKAGGNMCFSDVYIFPSE